MKSGCDAISQYQGFPVEDFTLKNALVMKILSVTPANMEEEGFFCMQNKKNNGFKAKSSWFEEQFANGLRFHLCKSSEGDRMGFVEFAPTESSWKPIDARNTLCIQCIMVYPNKFKNKGVGESLIREVEMEARRLGKAGVVVSCSDKPWIVNGSIFTKNGYRLVDKKEKYELYHKKFNPSSPDANFIDWTRNREKYQGWNLVYADQCPYHTKAGTDLAQTAKEYGVELNVTKISNSQDIKESPAGFGTFALIHDGKLLEDHYISTTRFENILKKELKLINDADRVCN